jgi:ubiquitin-protein ligase
LFAIGFARDVSASRVIADVGHITEPGYPLNTFVDFGPGVQEFGCLMGYLARSGHKTEALRRALAYYIPFVPFHVALARVVTGAPVSQLDVAVMIQCLAVFAVTVRGGSYAAALAEVGSALSDAVIGAPAAALAAAVPIDATHTWTAQAWQFATDLPRPRPWSGGPFDPVSPGDACVRTTMAVVRCTSDIAMLMLGRRPDGLPVWYSPPHGAVQVGPLPDDGPPSGPVEQVCVVLIDDSGSMRSVVPGMDTRKIAAAQTIAREFFAAAAFYSPTVLWGCATFAEVDRIRLGAAIPRVCDVSPRGQTGLWRTLMKVVAILRRFEHARRRIFVITDGEDVTDDDQLDVCREMLAGAIVLDAVLLRTSDDDTDHRCHAEVLPFALHSGGCCFCPKSVEEALGFIRKEEFVDLTFRGQGHRRHRHLPLQPGEVAAVTKWITFTAQIPSYMPYKRLDHLRTFDFVAHSMQHRRSYCITRILREMQICIDAGFPAFVTETILAWRVFMQAPLAGSDRASVYWVMNITFRTDYPYTAPTFRFLSLPPLKNVSALGRVRTSVTDNYHPRMHVAAILKHIQAGFETPEQLPPYAGDAAADNIKWNHADYETLVASGTVDPWLPIPDMEYLPIVAGDIEKNVSSVPPGKKKTDLSICAYSQLTWKKIEGTAETCEGSVIAPGEQKFFGLG